MQEILALAFEYLRGIWRFRWVGLIAAWVVCLAGWFSVAQMPEKYVASARVHIDSNTVLRPLLKGIAIQPNLDERITLLKRTLLSRPSLEKLMRMTDLDLQAKSEADKERIMQMLRGGVRLTGSRRNSSLYSVRFKHADRDTAKRVVQSVLTVFIERTLGEKRTESEGAQEFLDQQIKEYEQRLAEAEQRLADFKRLNAQRLPGGGRGYYSKLESTKGQVAAARLELRELENRRKKLVRSLQDEKPEIESGVLLAKAVSPLDKRIQALLAKRDGLLVTYTERHPAVRQTEGLIEQLKKERNAELAASLEQEKESTTGMQPNPVYQKIKNMITATEAEIASKTVRVGEYEKRVKDLQKLIDSIPQIEAQGKQLDRDYGIIVSQHKQLLKRRETVRLGEKVTQSADDVKFRVIEPPFVPAKPTEPDKVLLNTGVLGLGIGVGAGVALLISLLRPVFGDRRRLAVVTGLPILGTVTLVRAPEERRKVLISNLMFTSFVVILLLLYAGISVEQVLGLDLAGKLQSIKAGLL